MNIPYIFTAGTKAKAAEVNSNFKACADAINQAIVDIGNAKLELDNLLNTKANVNGDINQSFLVAPSNNPFGAVNNQQLSQLSNFFKPLVFGLTIVVNNDNLVISNGSAYDTNLTNILSLQVDYQHPINALNIGVYQVYLVGSVDNNDAQIELSNTTNPPIGDYRLIGTFIKDGDSITNIRLVGTRVDTTGVNING